MEDNKTVERKTLAILSIVFGAIALAFSWVPIINNLAALFAVAGAVMGIIALVRNRKSKKTKSIVGLVLSIVSFAIVMGTQSSYSKAFDEATGTSKSSSSSKSSTKWTQADFDSLKKGDMMSGAEGGDKLSDLTDKYGKPSSTSDSSVNNMDTKTVTWTNTNGSAGSNVVLSFMKASDGSYLLYSSAATGLK